MLCRRLLADDEISYSSVPRLRSLPSLSAIIISFTSRYYFTSKRARGLCTRIVVVAVSFAFTFILGDVVAPFSARVVDLSNQLSRKRPARSVFSIFLSGTWSFLLRSRSLKPHTHTHTHNNAMYANANFRRHRQVFSLCRSIVSFRIGKTAPPYSNDDDDAL